jgi:riboflavin synthase
MFTGIVAGRASVVGLQDAGGLRRLVVQLPQGAGQGLVIGASVSIAGTCLTAVSVQGDEVAFDCIDETLSRTTLGALVVGQPVNFERAARVGDEIGGHLLSGHILGMGLVRARDEHEGNLSYTFEVAPDVLRYVFSKGYIGIDGVSLTVGEVDPARRTFRVHLIPETRRVTTLDTLQLGDRVNIEVDALTQSAVDTVERINAYGSLRGS